MQMNADKQDLIFLYLNRTQKMGGVEFNLSESETICVLLKLGGDMAVDILTGKNAGIVTCAVTYGVRKKEDIIKAQPNYIIDDLIELKEIIK